MQETKKIGNCVLCGRNNIEITEHHLIPKTLHNNKYVKKHFTADQIEQSIDLCRACHNAVHANLDEKDLARSFNTIESLRFENSISKFVNWIKNKPNDLKIPVNFSNNRLKN